MTSIKDQTNEVNTPVDSITMKQQIIVVSSDEQSKRTTRRRKFDSTTNTISGTPTKVGSYPITVTTTDAEGNATTSFTIKVVDTTKPTVTAIKDQTKEVNTAIDSITIDATDNSGQAVTNKVSAYRLASNLIVRRTH